VDALNAAVVSDAMPEVRRWSAWALGEIADVRAVSSLIRALERDQVGEVRQWSAWALGEVGDARAHEALTAATRDSDSEVSAFAIRALLHLRHEVEHQIEHQR
jgi:HEAT repeat protein